MLVISQLLLISLRDYFKKEKARLKKMMAPGSDLQAAVSAEKSLKILKDIEAKVNSAKTDDELFDAVKNLRGGILDKFKAGLKEARGSK